jgi:hypothetical protein
MWMSNRSPHDNQGKYSYVEHSKAGVAGIPFVAIEHDGVGCDIKYSGCGFKDS